jgi:hypothetical protein
VTALACVRQLHSKAPRKSRLRHARRVILRCVVSGNGWQQGNRLQMPFLIPVAVVDVYL